MRAVQLLSGRGGWPMTVWLTPEREPFFAGTYFPARDGDRGVRTGFLTLLQRLRELHRQDPDRVTSAAASLTREVRESLTPPGGGSEPPPEAVLAEALRFYRERYDGENGGLSGAPKFPSSLPIRFLLREHRRTANAAPLDMAAQTLERMAAGGIHDHLGGGFHRYSTDARWLVPHFEKMLYDNALLTVAYLEAYQATGREKLARVARKTLEYVEREMSAPEGGFYSASDADSIGPEAHREEGYFFTWRPEEIEDTLGPKPAVPVLAYYGVTAGGNFEGRSILNVARSPEAVAAALGTGVDVLTADLERAEERLLAARSKRPAPARDEKSLAAWNGLMISAFARAGFVLGEDDYTARAARAADFVLTRMRDGERLQRSYKDGRAHLRAYLEDYAFVIAGLLDLFEATGEPRWLREATALDAVLESSFEDRDGGGYFLVGEGHEPLLAREKPAADDAEPSGNSVQALNLLDVTEEKRAAARLRQVIDLVPAFIFAKDPEGHFILANQALAEAHGTTVEGLLGKTVHDLGTDPEEARHFTEDDLEVIRTGRCKKIPEERFTDARGRERYLQTTKIPFTFSDSPAMLGVAVDISDRKAAEEALRRAAKEESLTVLAGGVAHDFNNLLAAVLGHVSLTLAKLPSESPARRHAEKAAATVERASDLTRQMLAYSGRGHFVIEPTDLGALVQENLPLLQVTLPKSVRVEMVLAADVPLVDADVGQIQQIVMNLVINAGEAFGEKEGTITVSTGTRELRPKDERFWAVTSHPLSPGRYVQLEVRDDGPGMDAETVSRIFDPFFTTKFTGRGLGLAAVLGVMRGHRGGLYVESEPGGGTAFQLLFVPSAREAAEWDVSVAPEKDRHLRVLLIDDEEVVREMVAEVLEHEGLEVLAAADGERGLELMDEHERAVDVVLLDLSMPGLSGQDTFARLAERHPDVPVILSSGYDHAEAMRRFEGRAPAGFIQKPYRPQQLLAEIHRRVGDDGDSGPPEAH